MIDVRKFGIRQEINIETLLSELAEKNLVFIEDCHLSLPYAENQIALIKALTSKEKFLVCLEDACRENVLKEHEPILALNYVEIRYLGVPGLFEKINNREINFWDAMKVFEKNATKILKENLEHGQKSIIICGGDHINHDTGIPFNFKGSSQIGIVLQNPDSPETRIYKIKKKIDMNGSYINKSIYEIIGRIS